MASIAVSFSCHTEHDQDVLDWLAQLDAHGQNKSEAIRSAIRASWLTNSLTLGDVLNEIGEIKRLLRSGVVAQGGAAAAPDQPEMSDEEKAAQAALDALDF